jgi:hypothetical protein
MAIGNVRKPVGMETDEEPHPGQRAGAADAEFASESENRSHDTSRIAWAKLLAKIVEAFPRVCHACGSAFDRPVFRLAIEWRRNEDRRMATPLPKPPSNLHPLSRELLERLAGHAEAAEIVIGGGVALSHYLEYRPTVDLDAWWHGEPRADVMAFLEAAMQAIASRHGFEYRRRSWGETESLELLQGTQKQFSFQISRRTLALDEAIPSQWEPVCIESLRDNVASKMTALVQRGAPRDFLDIYHLCTRDVMSMADCWHAFMEKGLGIGMDEARRKIIARLAMIEASRPLETIQPGEPREQAARVRAWYDRVFTVPTP